MSLDTFLTQLGLHQPPPNSLEAQLDAMRRDVRRIGKALARQAEQHTDDWAGSFGELSRDAMRQGSHLAEVASAQAWRGARQLRRDPLPALAVVGTCLLLARLLRR